MFKFHSFVKDVIDFAELDTSWWKQKVFVFHAVHCVMATDRAHFKFNLHFKYFLHYFLKPVSQQNSKISPICPFQGVNIPNMANFKAKM